MAKTLQDFITHIKQTGLPTSSHFYVRILGGGANETVDMLVDSINLPGHTIMTTNVRSYGEEFETPYGITYNNVNLNVLVDNQGTSKKFFDSWSNSVFDRETRFLNYNDSNSRRDVEIVVLNLKSEPIHSVTLKEAYPKSVADLSLDYGSHDVIRLGVSLTYRYFTQSFLGVSETADIQNRITALTKNAAYIDQYGDAYYEDLPSVESSLSPGETLINYGGNMGSAISRSCLAVNNSLIGSSMPQAGGFGSSFSSLGSNYSGLGETISNLGANLGALKDGAISATGVVYSVAQATGAISGTLGTINGLFGMIGLGSPLGGVIGNLNSITSKVAVLSNLGGIPGQVGAIGANMTGLGSVLSTASKSVSNVPGSTSQFEGALSKLGSMFGKQGADLQSSQPALNDLFGE